MDPHADELNESAQSVSDDSYYILTSLFSDVIRGRVEEAFESARMIEEKLHEDGDLAYKQFNKVLSKQDVMRDFLKAVELCSNEALHNILFALLEVYTSSAKGTVRTKRLRKLYRADATSSFIRTLRAKLRDRARCPQQTGISKSTEKTAELLLTVALKDTKVCLKIRVGGLLTLLCGHILEPHKELSNSLLRLLCRVIRSPRNGQHVGRQRGVIEKVIFRLKESVALENEREITGVLSNTVRLLEVAYFMTKNKKTRTQMVTEGAVKTVYSILVHQLEKRKENHGPLREEVALVAIALLRLIANNKRAKDELCQLGAIDMCEKSITSISNENEKDTVADQLQDSLCALCLRCLPLQPFPMGPNTVPFPLKMTLPSTRRRSTSKSERTKSNERAKTAECAEKRENRESGSSDDENEDEEDDVFSIIHGGKDNEEQNIGLCEDEIRDDEVEVEEPITFSRQKCSELKGNYDQFFTEYHSASLSKAKPSSTSETHQQSLQKAVQNCRSVMRFVKKAFPEMLNPDIDLERQPLVQSAGSMNLPLFRIVLRSDCLMHVAKELMVSELARFRLRGVFPKKVVFDLDNIVGEHYTTSTPADVLGNDDKQRVGRLDSSVDHLKFESRFESGNLRKAIQVGPTHYELILSPDINQAREHYQWFYFEVSNNKPNVMYTFEIINCLKTTSMFSHGMQPVIYSVGEAMAGKPGWVRAGHQVCYYRNLYTNATEKDENEKDEKGKRKERCFFSTRFTISFRHKADVCYVAYHFPYTYSYLQATLSSLMARTAPCSLVRNDAIGHSIGGNLINMITVTAEGTREEIMGRDIVFLSARVHPGESNSSWMMHGVLNLLITSSDPSVVELRDKFVFKLIPMLNPDGVINGSHRCSLVGIDLNRVWDRPSKVLHPEIHHSKGIVQYMVDVLLKKPFCVVDFHGHSRRSNVFMFGNNPEESWRSSDRKKTSPEMTQWSLLPELLDQTAPAFSFKNCRFAIAKSKEPSARIALWRQFGLPRVYTMESTYCGFDCGKYQGNQIGISELKDMGVRLAKSMIPLKLAVFKSSSDRTNTRTRRISSVGDIQ